MRRFSSYGPINPDLHYYAPRKELIQRAYTRLTAEASGADGHYITVWAPRQTGKTWVMQEVNLKINTEKHFEPGIITIEGAKHVKDEEEITSIMVRKLSAAYGKQFPSIKKIRDIKNLFTTQYFNKPVILIIDEFDSLEEDFIDQLASVFRDMYISRTNQRGMESQNKDYLLHGLALIGVRSVLGIENTKGSPFNVQQSLHIPNLTRPEVDYIFKCYEKDSGQQMHKKVIDRLYEETNGQPGLTCWFGELLTDTYKKDPKTPIDLKQFEFVHKEATNVLPNNNILNIISKAKQDPYKHLVLELFKTDRKIEFRFDDEEINYLYMNGIIDIDREPDENGQPSVSCKFANPFVQKRLFNHFARNYFKQMGTLTEPFYDLNRAITDTSLNIPLLLELYQEYLKKNKDWLFKSVPRRSDMRIYEAVYHFNLFSFLDQLLKNEGGRVLPEFPTGNGKIDLIITHAGKRYGIELKSFTNVRDYADALKQSARYGHRLELKEISLVFFIEAIDDDNRKKYQIDHTDQETGILVKPIFIVTS